MDLDKETNDKAVAILKQVEGMSIEEAQELLDLCSRYLLNQRVCFKKELWEEAKQ